MRIGEMIINKKKNSWLLSKFSTSEDKEKNMENMHI